MPRRADSRIPSAPVNRHLNPELSLFGLAGLAYMSGFNARFMPLARIFVPSGIAVAEPSAPCVWKHRILEELNEG